MTPDDTQGACADSTPSDAQLLYARVLHYGMLAGLVLLAVTYVIYVFGFMDPHVPLDELPRYYSLPVEEYLEKADVSPGWESFLELGRADFLCFLGLIVMAGLAIVCQLAVLPLLLKRRDKVYAVMAVLQIVVLAIAASGLLTGGR